MSNKSPNSPIQLHALFDSMPNESKSPDQLLWELFEEMRNSKGCWCFGMVLAGHTGTCERAQAGYERVSRRLAEEIGRQGV